jgi:hypothetical protein
MTSLLLQAAQSAAQEDGVPVPDPRHDELLKQYVANATGGSQEVKVEATSPTPGSSAPPAAPSP